MNNHAALAFRSGDIVEYHGSKVDYHGIGLVISPCECGNCARLALFGFVVDRFHVKLEGTSVHHVRAESITRTGGRLKTMR